MFSEADVILNDAMNALSRRIQHRFHESRADLFVRLMRPWPGARLLDLGGGDGSLAERITRRVPMSVTIADLVADNRDVAVRRGFAHTLVDGGGPLPFGRGEFDFVLCNSVIEHVTLAKEQCSVHRRVPQAVWVAQSQAAQRAFARRIVELGAAYFVQTPHRHFPVESHVHLPFVQYLSHNALCRVVRVTDRFWIKSCLGSVDWELLTPRGMAALFPDARIAIERWAGVPKSIIAWKGTAGSDRLSSAHDERTRAGAMR